MQVNDRSLVGSFSAGGINLAREPLNVALGASPPSMMGGVLEGGVGGEALRVDQEVAQHLGIEQSLQEIVGQSGERGQVGDHGAGQRHRAERQTGPVGAAEDVVVPFGELRDPSSRSPRWPS